MSNFCSALIAALVLGAVLWFVTVEKWQNEDNPAVEGAVCTSLLTEYGADIPYEENTSGEADAFPEESAVRQAETMPVMPEVAYEAESGLTAGYEAAALSVSETSFASKAVIAAMKVPEYEAGNGVGTVSDRSTGTQVPDAKELIAQPPRLMSPLQPEYPLKALNRGIEGRVEIRFTVNEQGRAENFEITKAAPPGIFEESAIKALEKARFEPARDKRGKAVGAILTLPINFRLH